MPLKTYDFGQVILSIGGATISGFAEGTAITIERSEDAYNLHIGADGEPTRAKSNNRSGLLTFSLGQASDSNDVMSAFAALDELSNSGVVPILAKDNSGRSIYFSGEGWVVRQPAAEFGAEVSDREWQVAMGVVEMFAGGN